MSERAGRRPPGAASRTRGEVDRRLDADLFRVLSDPTRLSLLACLAECARPCAVHEIAQCATVDLSVLSRYLQILAAAGVLKSRHEGRTVRGRIRIEHVCAALTSLAAALGTVGPTGKRWGDAC